MSGLSDLRGAVVWLTGVPGSGKTTLAQGLLPHLRAAGLATLWLDSDALRPVLTPRAGYEGADRDHFYAALGHIAALAAEGGVTAVVSATASRARYRDATREAAPRFVEIHLRCADDTLRRERDVKGLYARSDAGEITTLPGQGVPFEAPTAPEIAIDTTARSPQETLALALSALGA